MPKPSPRMAVRLSHLYALFSSVLVLSLSSDHATMNSALTIMKCAALSFIFAASLRFIRHKRHYYVSPQADRIGGAAMLLAGCCWCISFFTLQGDRALQRTVKGGASLIVIAWIIVAWYHVARRETKALQNAALKQH